MKAFLKQVKKNTKHTIKSTSTTHIQQDNTTTTMETKQTTKRTKPKLALYLKK
jgi:hypothetical protein